ncbi:MAG: hypothetical protein U9Q15_04120 [Patescibacteria group bacterium]|nr:hypothetical protein [Patescibacteria group bacterium]
MKKLILGISACVFVFGLFLQPDIALANSNSTESAPKAHITIQGVNLNDAGTTSPVE